jgi:anti-anti-sigma factor
MPATPFWAEVDGSPEVATIVLHGDVDVSAEVGLDAARAAAVAFDPPVILLDFSDVGYINSTGIALIVRLLAEARRDRRDVQATGLSPHYVEIFRITRLSDYVRILEDPADTSHAGAVSTPSTEGER